MKGNIGADRFDAIWAEAVGEQQPDWLQDAGSGGGSSGGGEVMAAIQAFIGADDWSATRAVVESRQEVLFRPEVEAIFEQNIADSDDARWQQTLQTHLDLLRACKSEGIGAAFGRLPQSQPQEEEDVALPFDEEVLHRVVAALRGGPEDKMACAQYLSSLDTSEDGMADFVAAVQRALFGGDLAESGRGLSGVYAAAWAFIVQEVEGGGLVQALNQIVGNTLAVLGPASDQIDEWRSALEQVRTQASAQGDSEMVALIDAVLALLAAGGNPGGIDLALSGPHAEAWAALLDALD
jgi:hypothetical protein